MPPTAILIRTPTDFSKTFSEVFQHFTMGTLRVEIEPVIRKCLEAIFNDLPYIERDDPDLVTAYLDSIAGPLTLLQAAGLIIFAVSSTCDSCGDEMQNDRLPGRQPKCAFL